MKLKVVGGGRRVGAGKVQVLKSLLASPTVSSYLDLWVGRIH